MKKLQFYVIDWAPNGTNDLIVRDHNGLQVDYMEGVLFGIDVNKLGPAKYYESHFERPEFRVSKKLIRKHVTSGPFGMGFEDNCKALKKYLNRGAK